jgi:adenylate cyclase
MPPPKPHSMLKTVLVTSLVVLLPLGIGRSLGGLESAELAAYDDFLNRRPVEKVDDRIVLVTISDDDIEQLQQYPLHDETIAEALGKLESYKPRAIGLDIARDIPYGPLAGRKRLTQVISKSERIVSGCLLSTRSHPGSPPAPGSPEVGVGFAEFSPDLDQVVRRAPLISTPEPSEKPRRNQHVCNDPNGAELPSLSFLLAQQYLTGADLNPEPTAKGDIQFGQRILRRINSTVGGYVQGDADNYQMLLNYRGAKSMFREVPIQAILRGTADPKSLRDRVILIGNTSEVSKDFLATPYTHTALGARNMHGVFVHAQAVSQILGAVLDNRPLIHSWPDWLEGLWIVGWGVGCGVVAFYNRRFGWFVVGVVAAGGILWGICYGALVSQGLWIPLVPALLAATLTALGVRLADLATRSGYAQAIYEQLREQMQGGGRDRRGDYLADLVQRARMARQAGDAAAGWSEPSNVTPPAMDALRQQIEAQVRQDLAQEQALRQTLQQMPNRDRSQRLQALVDRAHASRNSSSNPLPPPS